METWRLGCYHGYLERSQRQALWDFLRTLKNKSALPWVVIGDLNDLMTQAEKHGGRRHFEALIQGLNSALEDCSLIDLDMAASLSRGKRVEVLPTSWRKDWIELWTLGNGV